MGSQVDRHIKNVRLRYAVDVREMKARTRSGLNPARLDSVGSALAAYTQAYAVEHGCAPSWREAIACLRLNDQVAVPPTGMPSRFVPVWYAEATDVVFFRLRQAGWITFTNAPRSLQAGPRYHAASDGHERLGRQSVEAS